MPAPKSATRRGRPDALGRAAERQAILLARHRAEEDLLRANEALEARTRELGRRPVGDEGDARVDRRRHPRDRSLPAGSATFNQKFLEIWGLPHDTVAGGHHGELGAARGPSLQRARRGLRAHRRGLFGRRHRCSTPCSSPTGAGSSASRGRSTSTARASAGSGAIATSRATKARRGRRCAASSKPSARRAPRSSASAASRTSSSPPCRTSCARRSTPSSAGPRSCCASATTRRRLRRGLEAIERNARAQAQLIDDLLDMSRIISGKLRLDVQRARPGRRSSRPRSRPCGPSAEAKEIRLQHVARPAAGPVSGDPAPPAAGGLEPALATRSSSRRSGGRVEVALERVNSHVEISVARHRRRHRARLPAARVRPLPPGRRSTTRAHGGLGLGPVDRQAARRAARRQRPRDERGRGPGRDLHRHACRSTRRAARRSDAPAGRAGRRGRAGTPGRASPASRSWSSTTRPTRASWSSSCSRDADARGRTPPPRPPRR